MAEPTSRRRDPHPITANTPVNRAMARARPRQAMKNLCLMRLTSRKFGWMWVYFPLLSMLFAVFHRDFGDYFCHFTWKCRTCVAVENVLSSLFSLRGLNNPLFPCFSADFSTGDNRFFGGFPPVFPQPVKYRKIPLYTNTFSVFPTDGRDLSTEFSTICGKLSLWSFRACHTCPRNVGQPTTFPRQIHDIFRFFTCHTDKVTYFFHFFREFSLIFSPRNEFSAFPHEFSTACGKSCG